MTEPLDLEAVRRALGGRLSADGRRWCGPGPGHSKRDGSLSVRIREDGAVLIHSFAGDAFDACAQHLGLDRRPGQGPAWRRAPVADRRAAAKQRSEEAAMLAFCTGVWAERGPIGGSPAADHLMRRGLPGPFPDALAFHADAPFTYRGDRGGPAMMALARDRMGQITGLHLTSIGLDHRRDGKGRRLRRMFGRMSGSAVQLAPMGADGVLAVAEGIETALAFGELHAVACWAALSASGLTAFRPPPGLRRLIIAADGDPAGANAALTLADRLKDDCAVDVSPARDGFDWNDELLNYLKGGAR
ncbi:MAG: hypothetical protein JWP35_1449 [Caulobacter sp.]|nr:hypothetical protein [Caulobacter sp.]